MNESTHLGLVTQALFVLLAFASVPQFSAVASADDPHMSIEKRLFGKMPDGTEVDLYMLSNGRGLEATVLTLGATLHTVSFPDRYGKSAVLTRHEDTVAARLNDVWATGAIVGRFANRIANAQFTIDGVEYKLPANAGKHQIHGGGPSAFHRQIWKAEPAKTDDSVGVKLQLISPDGQGGYPGTLTATVTYSLNRKNELTIDYVAVTDKTTHVNLTNHAYWNLGGVESGDVKQHVLQIHADAFLAVDSELIPTGEICEIKSGPFDFNTARAIGTRFDELPKKQYDNCYILTKPVADKSLALAARVVDPVSGRVMEVLTTQPGLQFFTGHPKGLCLETEHYPDTPHHSNFPSTLLHPGETFHEQTVHRFSLTP